MGKHREQGHFDRARWRLALLVPFWILQVVFLLSLMGVFSYRLVATSELLKDEEKKASVSTVKIVWEVLNVGFALVCLGLCLVEVAKFLTETLTPLFMLVSHIIKAVLSVAVLGLDVAVHLKNMDGKYTVIGLGIDVGLLLATLIPTIYSIIVYRRHLKYSDYQHPVNAKSYGFSTPPKLSTPPSHGRLELGDGFYTDGCETSYASQTSAMSSSRSRSGSCYKPGGGGAAAVANRPRSLLSVRSDRRVSSGASSILTMLDTSGGGGRDSFDLAKTRAAAASPREPYSHERSTEFEEYVKRRSMFAAGGSDGSSTTTPDALSPGGGGGGTRCTSWASSRGLMPVPEGQEASSGGNGNGAYSPYSPYRSNSISKSIASAISPPGSPVNGPPGFGAAPSPHATYGSRRNRAGSGESDRAGLLADSEDIGNQSMPRR